MCEHPYRMYFLRQYPISYKDLPEHIQKQYNVGHFAARQNEEVGFFVKENREKPIGRKKLENLLLKKEEKEITEKGWKPSKYTYVKEIPCGWCLECRLAKAKDWATRAVMEAKMHSENCFVTLTYNEENLPHTSDGRVTLKKKDVQDFFKRLIKKYPNNGIKRLYCGEYGPKRGRSHYHAIIFGYIPKDLVFEKYGKNRDMLYKSKELAELWGKGFVTVGHVTAQSAGYVARYTMKKAGIKPKKRIRTPNPLYNPLLEKKMQRNVTKYLYPKDEKEKEFLICSRRMGIGYEYWELNKDKIIREEGIYVKTTKGVQLNQIPKAFIEKWKKSENWEDAYRYIYKMQLRQEEWRIKELKMHEGMSEEELKQQKIKFLHNKIKQLKREEDFNENFVLTFQN